VPRDVCGLRICFVAGTLGQGGAERQLYYIVSALAEMGTDVRVLSLTRGEFWERNIRDRGVRVEWVGEPRSRLGRIGAIVRAARAQKADIIQSQHFYTNLYAVGAARVLRSTEVGAIRCNARWEVSDLGSVLGPLSLRTPRTIVANSRAAIRSATEMGVPAARLRYLPNVVDTSMFEPVCRVDSGAENPVRIIAVGRRVPQKRFDRFLSVIAEVRRRTTRPIAARLVTTGTSGIERLSEQAGQLGLLDGTLEFSEALSDMASVYRDAEILVLTSDWEGTPNVVLEAMSSGLPVVATNVGGVADLIQSGVSGWLAHAGDDSTLVNALLRLVDDDAGRAAMGQRGREHVLEHHALACLPGRLTKMYEAVLT
jgi:glycosyltransferase involved in cell wall biosynthesis